MKTWHHMAVILTLAISALPIAPSPASAHEEGDGCHRWVQKRRCDFTYGFCTTIPVRIRTHCYGERYYDRSDYERPRRYYRDRDERRYEDWEGRRDYVERGVACKGEYVMEIGDAHNTTEGALRESERRWQERVRHFYGEIFMSLEDARGYRKRCTRASTNESVVGKVIEGIGRAAGNDGSFQKRCAVVAYPCRAPMTGEGDDRR